MSAWEGFTDEDLQRIKGSGDPVSRKQDCLKDSSFLCTVDRRKASSGRSRTTKKVGHPVAQDLTEGAFFHSGKATKSPNDAEELESPSSHGHKTSQSSTFNRTSGMSTYGTCVVDSKGDASSLERRAVSAARPSDSGRDRAVGSSKTSQKEDAKLQATQEESDDASDVRVCTDEELQSLQKSRLEVLQQQQQQLKELNQRKQAQLHQTLQERYQQTQKETLRLQLVQKELSHLDNVLSDDVTILRGKIEEAVAAFTSAEKRYNTAEAEFVAAKLWLHRCREQKELLTEHLFTIIQQNEVRKARKIAELMGHLEMDGVVSVADLPTLPALPMIHSDVKPVRQEQSSPTKAPLHDQILTPKGADQADLKVMSKKHDVDALPKSEALSESQGTDEQTNGSLKVTNTSRANQNGSNTELIFALNQHQIGCSDEKSGLPVDSEQHKDARQTAKHEPKNA